MTLKDFDLALGVVNRCPSSSDIKVTAALMGASQQLQNGRSQALSREERVRASDEEAVKRQLQAEQKAAEVRAKAEECRQQCAQKVAAMLNELRSLGTDEAGIKRLRDLGREHGELVSTMPADVRTSLARLNDAFANEYRERDTTARQVEDELKQKTQNEAKNHELAMLYLMYLELQFCAERYRDFEEAKATAREVAKRREAYFSSNEIDKTWRSTAELFAKMEPVLKATGQFLRRMHQSQRYPCRPYPV
jgi:hypothetical protein